MNRAGEGFQLALVPANAVEEEVCFSTELTPTALIHFSSTVRNSRGAARRARRLLDAGS